MTFRVVASDLDGTLLRGDLTVSPRSVAVLDRAADAGIRFVMVTGRPVRWLPPVFEHTRARGPVVCANGAVIYDPERDEIMRGAPLAADVVAEVVAALRRELPDVVFAVEIDHGRAMLSEAAWPAIVQDIGHRIVDHTELAGAPAVKLLARLPGGAPDEFLAATTRLLDGTAQVTSSSRSAMVEISAAGVTKASGLAWLAERAGVHPGQVVAYGDMPNDVPMFAWAGRGVAVANAHPSLLEVADEVTASNDEDGVAVHLENLLN
ncbi:MAG TPA: HAD family hydrolase [Micromonosporaceae bacterium]